MKKLKNILKESILNNNTNVFEGIENEITEFIESNYNYNRKIIISNKPNKSGKYEVSSNGDVEVKNKNITSLTNNMFEWSKVKGDFDVYNCFKLKSLKGAPKEVGGNFDCGTCVELESLEGAPEEVGKDFDCGSCEKLKSLEGAPEKVGKIFACSWCRNLKSLKGAPKYVGKDFYCARCGTKFTDDDVRKVSDVGRKIIHLLP